MCVCQLDHVQKRRDDFAYTSALEVCSAVKTGSSKRANVFRFAPKADLRSSASAARGLASAGRGLINEPLIGAPAAKIIWAVAVVGLERLGRLRLVTGGDRVEELADQAQTIHLVVVLAGRE